MQEQTANTSIQKCSSSTQKFYNESTPNQDKQIISPDKNETDKIQQSVENSDKNIQKQKNKNIDKDSITQPIMKKPKLIQQIQSKIRKIQTDPQNISIYSYKFKAQQDEDEDEQSSQTPKIKKDLNLLDLPIKNFQNQESKQLYFSNEQDSIKISQNSDQQYSDRDSSNSSIHQDDSQDVQDTSINLLCVDEQLSIEESFKYNMQLLYAVSDVQIFQYSINQGNVPLKIKKILKSFNDQKKISQIFQKTDHRKLQKRKKEHNRKSFRPVLMTPVIKNQTNICIQLVGHKNPENNRTEYCLEQVQKDQVLFHPRAKVKQEEIKIDKIQVQENLKIEQNFQTKLSGLNLIDDQLIVTKINYSTQNKLQNMEKINLNDFFMKDPQKCFEFVSNEYTQLLRLYCYQHKKLKSINECVKDYNQIQ